MTLKKFYFFEKLFYSPKAFGDWKKSSGNTSIILNDLSKTENIDGFEFSTGQEDLLALFASEKKSGHFILIRSGQPVVLNGLLKYSLYIKNLVNNNYVRRAKSEINLIETRFDNLLL
jgi:hypothetical protein